MVFINSTSLRRSSHSRREIFQKVRPSRRRYERSQVGRRLFSIHLEHLSLALSVFEIPLQSGRSSAGNSKRKSGSLQSLIIDRGVPSQRRSAHPATGGSVDGSPVP